MLLSRSSSTSSTSSLVAPSTSNHYIRSGIGGAGNYQKAAEVPSALPIPQFITTRHGSFSSGVGGAGNIHDNSKRPSLSVEEEFARELAIKRNARPAYYVGIGGAGNYVQKTPQSALSQPVSESSYSSSPLPVNGFDVLRRRLSEAFSSFSFSRSRRPSVDDSSDSKSLVA